MSNKSTNQNLARLWPWPEERYVRGQRVCLHDKCSIFTFIRFYPFEAIELDSVYMQSSKENVDKQGVIVRRHNRRSWQRICCPSTLYYPVWICRLLSSLIACQRPCLGNIFKSLCNLNPSLVLQFPVISIGLRSPIILVICTLSIFFSNTLHKTCFYGHFKMTVKTLPWLRSCTKRSVQDVF